MANAEHVALLHAGRDAIVEWRKANPKAALDLTNKTHSGAFLRSEGKNRIPRGQRFSGLDLRGVDLRGYLEGVYLVGCDLADSVLAGSDLSRANLSGTNLQGADLRYCSMHGIVLADANLADATLFGSDLTCADMRNADLRGADLRTCIFRSVVMYPEKKRHFYPPSYAFGGGVAGANFEKARLANTIFVDIDLSKAKNLELADHEAKSHIGLHALIASHGKLPDQFLRGCGYDPLFQRLLAGDLRDKIDSFYRWLDESGGDVILQSCFISYSTRDKPFVDRLQESLNAQGIDYWYAPEHGRAGERLEDQIDREIHLRDRLLVVCSRHSLLKSPWVIHEITAAFDAEDVRRRSGRSHTPIVFPVLLDDTLLDDAVIGLSPHRDLFIRMREVLAADFRGRTKGRAFQAEVARLLRGLRRTSSGAGVFLDRN